jgi:hypothetical protein
MHNLGAPSNLSRASLKRLFTSCLEGGFSETQLREN